MAENIEMNISIELEEAGLSALIERYIQNVLRYSDYHQSDLAREITNRVHASLDSQIKALDLDALVLKTAEKYIPGIVEDVVKKKLTDLVRASVKELKERGELLK
jgi:DNA-binding HxlR family transcriptional regulator